MGAVRYRLKCLIGAQWSSSALLALVIALLVGVVLMFTAGARRTLSAPDRYEAALGTANRVSIFEGGERGLRTRGPELATLAGARAVSSITFIFGRLTGPTGAPVADDISVFSGTIPPTGERLVSGREPNSQQRGEFVADRAFIEASRAAIGDHFQLDTFTQEQADAAGFDAGEPAGPSTAATLVGIIDGPAALDDPTPFVLFSPALLQDPTIGVAISISAVDLQPGVTLDAFQAQVDELPASNGLSLSPATAVSANVRAAVAAQGRGLQLLALAAAIAAAAVLVQLLVRHARLTPLERGALGALGFTRRQMLAESTGRAAVPIAAGSLLGAVAATLPSSIFPSGFAHRVEPHQGFSIDAVVLGIGAVAATGVLLCLTSIALVLLTGNTWRRPSTRVDLVAQRLRNPRAATGVRLALTRQQRDPGSITSTVIGLALTCGGLIGAMTFSSSLNRVVAERARFGNNFDALFNNGADTLAPELVTALHDDPGIADLTLFADGLAAAKSAPLQLVGFQPIKGSLAPRLLEGRLPVSEDEVALGRVTARDLGADVGRTISVEGDSGLRVIRVTGLVIVPTIGSSDGVGKGAVLTMAAMEHLNPGSSVAATPTVRLGPGAPADTLDRLSRATGVQWSAGSVPPAIVNVSRVRTVPVALAAFLGGLLALSVAHVAITSLQKRRRDLAVLSALGADRRWLTAVSHWQATALSGCTALLGIPLGVLAGRTVFRVFADSIGTRNDAALPWGLLAAALLAVVVLANVAVAWPAIRARRVASGGILRAE